MIASYMRWTTSEHRDATIARMIELLKPFEFDVLVGRGVSGLLLAPVLAYEMNKGIGAVRKPEDGSHSPSAYEGDSISYRKWVFVDDFVSSGETLWKTARSVSHYFPTATLVGAALYDTNQLYPPESCRAITEKWDRTYQGASA